MYQGQSIQVVQLEGGIAELKFDRKDDAINKFDLKTLNELRDAVAAISATDGI